MSRADGTNPRALGTSSRQRGANRRADPLATADLTPDELRAIGEESYALYRRTKHWLRTRRAAVKRAGGKCRCGATTRLDVRHRTYERLGEELDVDVEVLCRGCHEAERATLTASGAWLRDSDGRIIGRVLEIVVDVAWGTFKEGVVVVGSGVNSEPITKEEGCGEKPNDIERIWARYVDAMQPRHQELDAGARALIRDALKVATAIECMRAVDGCRASAFHMGANDRSKKYNRLSQILKGKRGIRTTREQIDLFIDIAEKVGVGGPTPSVDPARLSQAKRDVLAAWEMPGNEQAIKAGEMSAAWLAQHGYRIEYDVQSGRPSFVRDSGE